MTRSDIKMTAGLLQVARWLQIDELPRNGLVPFPNEAPTLTQKDLRDIVDDYLTYIGQEFFTEKLEKFDQ